MRNAVPSGRTPWRTIGIDVALLTGMRATTSFDLWSTEQVLLVYERYFGKLDAKTRRRIVDVAVQEWSFFGSRIAAPNDFEDDPAGIRGEGEDGSPDGRRRRRPRLPPA